MICANGAVADAQKMDKIIHLRVWTLDIILIIARSMEPKLKVLQAALLLPRASQIYNFERPVSDWAEMLNFVKTRFSKKAKNSPLVPKVNGQKLKMIESFSRFVIWSLVEYC